MEKNLLRHLKNCMMAIWKGEPFPDESEKSKVFGHHIAFLETMSESVPQLCLQLIILRQFGLSKNVFQALTQTTALYSSIIATCILFAKVRTRRIHTPKYIYLKYWEKYSQVSNKNMI